MTLSQLAALRGGQDFLGSDTGPLHLAAAVGTPCVGLYGPWPAEKHGPFGPQHVVVQKMRMEGSTRQPPRRRPSIWKPSASPTSATPAGKSFPAPPLFRPCHDAAACGKSEMPAMLGLPGSPRLPRRGGVARLATGGAGPGRRRGDRRRPSAGDRPPHAPHRHLQHRRLQGRGRAARRRSRGRVPGRPRLRRPPGSPRALALAESRSSPRTGHAAGAGLAVRPEFAAMVLPRHGQRPAQRGRCSSGSGFPWRAMAAAASATPFWSACPTATAPSACS